MHRSVSGLSVTLVDRIDAIVFIGTYSNEFSHLLLFCCFDFAGTFESANLGVRLDLKRIALKCRNTEFNPRRFGAVIMRLREPRATALIFASGKMCITGVKSTHNATLATKRFAYIVERVGFKPQDYLDFKVQNMVGTTDVGFPIRLEGLVYAHSSFASYEPELFPGPDLSLGQSPCGVSDFRER